MHIPDFPVPKCQQYADDEPTLNFATSLFPPPHNLKESVKSAYKPYAHIIRCLSDLSGAVLAGPSLALALGQSLRFKPGYVSTLPGLRRVPLRE